MRRHIKLTVEITLMFEGEIIDDREAIDRFLDSNIRETVNGITVYAARVTDGLVDHDGVPVPVE